MLAVLPHFVGMDFEFVALVPGHPLARSLQDLGIPTVLFTVRDAAGARRPEQQILEDLNGAIRRIQPDLVHGNSLAMGRLTGSIAGQTAVRLTAHLRDIVGQSPAAVGHLNANHALVAVSHAVRDYHVAQGVDPRRVHVVPNGVDCHRFDGQATDGRLKSELGLPSDSFLIATIGQICLRKGHDVFAQAAVQVAERMPRAHFLLVGERYSAKPESVEYERGISRAFDEAGLSQRFHRLGYRTDMPQLLPEIDLVVHTARQEPFGRVLLESAAVGRPIVATSVGGTTEMLVDGDSALLVPPDAPMLTAQAMLRCYHDGDLRRRIGAAARDRVSHLFTVETSAARLAEVWRNTVEG